MAQLIYITLFGWIPFSLALFVVLPPERAVALGIVGGWLFLPPVAIPMSGLPDYDKLAAITGGICLATLIFQPNRLLNLRGRWIDLVIVGWCLCPLATSIRNGLGVYDGLSSCLTSAVRWGFPYLIGRLYLGTLEELRKFAIAMVVGGVVYVIPTVFEIRMSPLLRVYVYGITSAWGTRFGGWRPLVFLSTALEHGMWMTIVSVIAVWLWRSGTLRRIGVLPFGSVVLPCLLIVTLLCRSSGALFLLAGGLLILWACTAYRSKILIYLLLLAAPTYYALRIPNIWTGENLVNFLSVYFSEERAESLQYRFRCENLLAAKALQQPIWGWGGWGRSRITGPDGRDQAPTDGMWIIFFGGYGFAGLFLWTASMILPPFMFVRRYPVEQWTDPMVAPAAAIAVLLGLYQVDSLLNGFLNLPILTAAGGLACISSKQYRRSLLEDPLDPGPEPEGSIAREAQQPVSPQVQLADRYARLARTLRSRGSLSESRAALSHALELLDSASADHQESPGTRKARWDCVNNLAWFLLSESESPADDLRVALRLATQATEAEPQCAAYWNTLGAAHLQAGDAERSIGSINRSMSLSDGGTAFDFLILAMAHAQLNEEGPARDWYAQAGSWMERHDPQAELLQLDKVAIAYLNSCFGQST
ncbi:MAG: hypothetical protein U0790_02250 [Isosphaeraceae bacterium]